MALDMKIELVKIIVIVVLTATVAGAVFAYRNMRQDILNERFLEKKDTDWVYRRDGQN